MLHTKTREVQLAWLDGLSYCSTGVATESVQLYVLQAGHDSLHATPCIVIECGCFDWARVLLSQHQGQMVLRPWVAHHSQICQEPLRRNSQQPVLLPMALDQAVQVVICCAL